MKVWIYTSWQDIQQFLVDMWHKVQQLCQDYVLGSVSFTWGELIWLFKKLDWQHFYLDFYFSEYNRKYDLFCVITQLE